jgi:hypothetical protein
MNLEQIIRIKLSKTRIGSLMTLHRVTSLEINNKG